MVPAAAEVPAGAREPREHAALPAARAVAEPEAAARGEGAERVGARLEPELKGSVGEGPNQTNYSDRSSVRILAKFRNFR